MKTFIKYIYNVKKWKLFALFLLFITLVSTILSIITDVAFLEDDKNTRPRIAIVVPDNEMGASFKKGAQFYIEIINKKNGGHNGRLIEFFVVDETLDAVKKIVSDKRVIGVVGYLDSDILQQSLPLYEQNHIPIVTPLFFYKPLTGITALGLDLKKQARFVANYAFNIRKQHIMYVVYEDSTEFNTATEHFLDIYQKLGIPVKKAWILSKGSEAQFKQFSENIKNIDSGGIFVIANPEFAARIVKSIRDTGNALDIYGSQQLSSSAFSTAITALSRNAAEAAALTHGIITASPTLFDTANEKAQYFQSKYQKKYGQAPDWLASYAYDAAHVVLTTNPGVDDVEGITGKLSFIDHRAHIPSQIGIYNGSDLVSAPVQFLPIAKGADFDYNEALRQGRIVKVDDRFMFKTNVVYVGITANEITDINLQDETAMIDLSIWFRYRGNFSPQDLQISNAVDAIKLNAPEEANDNDHIQYRRYRIKQKFKLNFTDAKRTYGEHIAGISFRHKQLNRNNLMYVVDVLGMPAGNALITDIIKRKVVKSTTFWKAASAWAAQDITTELSEGAPQYIGMTGEQPLFSKITFGILLKPSTISVRELIPKDYFIYIAIFGVIGSAFSVVLDKYRWVRYWAFQSWLLRIIFWPLMLLSLGNITLDWAFANLAAVNTRIFVIIYECLWWLIAARLINIGVRRLVWDVLAQNTQHNIPNIIKLASSLLVYLMACSVILSVEFNQSLTSLLATSGVLAMVIGLALKDIIANVFSGIILNIEKPFKVGDYIKVNNIVGKVKDISWRTTHIESTDGHMVSLANAKVSEAFTENFSQAPIGLSFNSTFCTAPETDPAVVKEIINEALTQSKFIKNDVPECRPKVRYTGINIEGKACYDINYYVTMRPKKGPAIEEILLYVRQKFIERGFPIY